MKNITKIEGTFKHCTNFTMKSYKGFTIAFTQFYDDTELACVSFEAGSYVAYKTLRNAKIAISHRLLRAAK